MPYQIAINETFRGHELKTGKLYVVMAGGVSSWNFQQLTQNSVGWPSKHYAVPNESCMMFLGSELIHERKNLFGKFLFGDQIVYCNWFARGIEFGWFIPAEHAPNTERKTRNGKNQI